MWAKLIDFAIWYRILFIIASFKFPDTPEWVSVYLKGRREGLQIEISPLSWCRVCTVCDVRVTTDYSDAGNTGLSLVSCQHPEPWLAGPGAWRWGGALKWFRVFGNPSQSRQSSRALQNSLRNTMDSAQYSTQTVSTVCTELLHTFRHPDAAHWVTCSSVCSNMNR